MSKITSNPNEPNELKKNVSVLEEKKRDQSENSIICCQWYANKNCLEARWKKEQTFLKLPLNFLLN